MTRTDIEILLQDAFHPTFLHIEDESDLHRGHYTNQAELSHLHIHVVSEKFKGLSAVARHRAVYALLEPAFSQGLHAVRLTTLAPEEK